MATEAPPGIAEGSGDQPRFARRTLVVVVVLVLLALAVAWQVREPVPEPLLGHLGQRTGLTATGPPPSGLRLAWAYESPASADGRSGSRALGVVARGDRVRVDNLVVDLQEGQVVGVTPDLWPATGVQRTVVDGRELLVVDTLSGEVRSRATLPDHLPDYPHWDIRRGQSASLVGLEDDSVLVADDGSVVAEVDGHFLSYVDRAFDEPAAFPVRGRVTENELQTPLRLIRADTGEVVADLSESRIRVADVSGDLALVASTDAITSPFDASNGTWTVVLLDARTGEQRVQLTAVSREPPRLLGTFGDGTAVVTSRVGDEYPLLAVTPTGEVARIAQPGRRSSLINTGFIASSALSAAAMAGDVLVVNHGDGEVVGLDRSGSRLWELDAPGTAGMSAGGGYVALFGDEDRRIRLVRTRDGEVVATLDPPEEDRVVADVVGRPVGAIGGYMGISRSGRLLTPYQGPLVGTRWFDLQTGEEATLKEVFAPFVGHEEGIGVDWIFHGIVTGEEGEPEPVISRTQPQSNFELLKPGEGFRSYRLPLPPTDGEPAFGVASVGASADRFVVWREGTGLQPATNDPVPAPQPSNTADLATIVLDRTSGESTTIEGLRGVALLDDLLLAEEIDQSSTMTALVAVDPANGQERWRVEPNAPYTGEEVLRVDADLFIDTGVARVTARSTRDGTQRWTHASDTELSGEAVLGPRHVVVATTNGELVALDRGNGAVAWRADVKTPIASLTGAGDHVLVGTHDGLIVHLDGRGREVQRIAVGTGAVHDVAALGKTVVAVVDGRVIGLRDDGTGIIRDDEVEVP